MNNSDSARFLAIMQGLAENFGTQLSDAGLDMRFQALKQYSIEEVNQAALAILAGRKYTSMPTVADFIDNLSGGSAEDVAELEAAKVWQAIKRYGGWQSVVFDDPVTQSVIALSYGGWPKLCSEMMEDQQKWFTKDFAKSYGAFARRGVKTYGQLPGRGTGEPVLIGCAEKAQAVLEQGEKLPALEGGKSVKALLARLGGGM